MNSSPLLNLNQGSTNTRENHTFDIAGSKIDQDRLIVDQLLQRMPGVMFQSMVKRPRLDESDLDVTFDEDSNESSYSYQGYETAWVKDSGDDWSPPSSSESSQVGSDGDATDVIYEVEYEIASDATNDQDISSSGDSDIEAMIIPIIAANFEDECWAESESSDEGVIIRLPSPLQKTGTRHPADGWKCLRCSFPIIPPARYCHTCYQIRKEAFAPRPKYKRRKRGEWNASSGRAGPSSSGAASSQEADGSHPSACSSGISSLDDHGASIRSTASSQEAEEPLPSSQKDPQRNCPCATEMCGSCGERKPDGAFIHGQTAHQIYCFPCSKKMRSQMSNRCPICRRTIDKVVKMFRAIPA